MEQSQQQEVSPEMKQSQQNVTNQHSKAGPAPEISEERRETTNIVIIQLNKGKKQITVFQKHNSITTLESLLDIQCCNSEKDSGAVLVVKREKTKNKNASILEEQKILQLSHDIQVEAILYQSDKK